MPIHYNYLVQAAIYNSIDSELANFLHEKGYVDGSRSFKLFSFSLLQGTYQMDRMRKTIAFEGEINLTVSSPLQDFCQSLVNKQDRKVSTADEKKQFLCEADNLLNQLTDVGLFPSVTHHLLETLEAFISLEPVIIFEKIGRIVNTAQQGGYQYESLAENLKDFYNFGELESQSAF